MKAENKNKNHQASSWESSKPVTPSSSLCIKPSLTTVDCIAPSQTAIIIQITRPPGSHFELPQVMFPDSISGKSLASIYTAIISVNQDGMVWIARNVGPACSSTTLLFLIYGFFIESPESVALSRSGSATLRVFFLLLSPRSCFTMPLTVSSFTLTIFLLLAYPCLSSFSLICEAFSPSGFATFISRALSLLLLQPFGSFLSLAFLPYIFLPSIFLPSIYKLSEKFILDLISAAC